MVCDSCRGKSKTIEILHRESTTHHHAVASRNAMVATLSMEETFVYADGVGVNDHLRHVGR